MKALIGRLSAPGEFWLVLLACSGIPIMSSIGSIATHSWDTAAPVRVTDTNLLLVVILDVLALAVLSWIGRARGWSLTGWGLRPSWKYTAAGVLLFLLVLLLSFAVSALFNHVSPGTLHRRTNPNVSLLFVAMIVAINPVFEEALEVGYFVQSLQRYGSWIAISASAAFRAFLHSYQGINALVIIFPLGLIFGVVYWKSRRLWLLTVAHGLLDLYAFLPGIHVI